MNTCELTHLSMVGKCRDCPAVATHDHGDGDKFCCDHH